MHLMCLHGSIYGLNRLNNCSSVAYRALQGAVHYGLEEDQGHPHSDFKRHVATNL